jgi:hypothetical protein
MRTKKASLALALGLVVAVAVAAFAVAAEPTVTLTGTVSCAKCTLKKADATACQDVLVVTGPQAGEYYIAKNDVSEKFGHLCNGSRKASATGTVAEKDGKKWITPTLIELVRS